MALADQAEACPNLSKNVSFKHQDIGFLGYVDYSNGEPRALRPTDCQKLRRMRSFEICMEEKQIFCLPFYHFLNDSFNILFINDTGVYNLFDHLVDFFGNIELEN